MLKIMRNRVKKICLKKAVFVSLFFHYSFCENSIKNYLWYISFIQGPMLTINASQIFQTGITIKIYARSLIKSHLRTFKVVLCIDIKFIS